MWVHVGAVSCRVVSCRVVLQHRGAYIAADEHDLASGLKNQL